LVRITKDTHHFRSGFSAWSGHSWLILSLFPWSQIFGPGANALAPLPLAAAAINAYNVPRRNNGSNRKNNVSDSDSDAGVELPKGYYVLNKKATRLSGVPKYVYLGPEEPQE
jgi:hypothetical protein